MTIAVEIPGGTAWLREPFEMNVGHWRMVESHMIPLKAVYGRVSASLAQRTLGSGPDADAAREEAKALIRQGTLTEEQAEATERLRDAVIVASLSHWTLPRELPTLETVRQIPPDVFDALDQATQRRYYAAENTT